MAIQPCNNGKLYLINDASDFESLLKKTILQGQSMNTGGVILFKDRGQTSWKCLSAASKKLSYQELLIMFYNFLVPPCQRMVRAKCPALYIFSFNGGFDYCPHYNHNRWSCIYFLAAQGKMRAIYTPDVKNMQQKPVLPQWGCLFSLSLGTKHFFFGRI